MLSWSTIIASGLAISGAQATPVEVPRQATPTVYLAGDSTMAKTGNGLMGKSDFFVPTLIGSVTIGYGLVY